MRNLFQPRVGKTLPGSSSGLGTRSWEARRSSSKIADACREDIMMRCPSLLSAQGNLGSILPTSCLILLEQIDFCCSLCRPKLSNSLMRSCNKFQLTDERHDSLSRKELSLTEQFFPHITKIFQATFEILHRFLLFCRTPHPREPGYTTMLDSSLGVRNV
jgi:hypothetical protein